MHKLNNFLKRHLTNDFLSICHLLFLLPHAFLEKSSLKMLLDSPHIGATNKLSPKAELNPLSLNVNEMRTVIRQIENHSSRLNARLCLCILNNV